MPANRLIHEKSPYLQQHAYNPVDWHPWNDDALAKARLENKPIFLSVGYSTCHWCHVMEHESFEDAGIAQFLNQHFVPVKVDREERPDIDRVYMSYVQASTGSGGWPMSVWLTPDGKPFVGGTYFPPEDRYGRPGFLTVLRRIAAAWRDERPRLLESSSAIAARLEKLANVSTPFGQPRMEALENAFSVWSRSFDARLGGFGDAPKFPRPAVFEFLLTFYIRTQRPEALEMVVKTLTAMSDGGMNDQLGGGFHRYSVDPYWFVPHFEKMLYDQAQIAISLIETFQITRDDRFAREARRVLDYVLRDMTSPNGGFYSAEDADSVIDEDGTGRKGEGAFYLFSAQEIAAAASEAGQTEGVRYFQHHFGVEENGNVQQDPHGEFAGKNILFRARSLEETAHHFDAPLEDVQKTIAAIASCLLNRRATRTRPHLDDKILTAWNGLMISAFAKAGAILDEPRYAAAARAAADFIRDTMWTPGTGALLRRYREGDAAIDGFLDDYAFFAQALLDLYEAQLHWTDLELAMALCERMRERFEDRDGGGFFSTAHASLLMRMKDDYDGAEPSGNSVATLNLLRLERMTGRREFGDSARRTLAAFAGRMDSQPSGVPLMLSALCYSAATPAQIVLAGERGSRGMSALLEAIHSTFDPNRVVLLVDSESKTTLTRSDPAIEAMAPVNGQPAAYVCQDFVCAPPVTGREELFRLLQSKIATSSLESFPRRT